MVKGGRRVTTSLPDLWITGKWQERKGLFALRNRMAQGVIGRATGTDRALGRARAQVVNETFQREMEGISTSIDMINAMESQKHNELMMKQAEADYAGDTENNPAGSIVPVIDSKIARQRVEARASSEAFNFQRDRLGNFSRQQLIDESHTAFSGDRSGGGSWYKSQGGKERFNALIQTMEANGMGNQIFELLKDAEDNNVRLDASSYSAMSGSKDKTLKAYGKKGFDESFNHGEGRGVTFSEFMTGTGGHSMRQYISEKGGDFLKDVDDKALGQIRQYEEDNGQRIIDTDLLASAAAKVSGEDAMEQINAMMARRDDVNFSADQLAKFNTSTVGMLIDQADSGNAAAERALMAATDALAKDRKLANRVSATNLSYLDGYRLSRGKGRIMDDATTTPSGRGSTGGAGGGGGPTIIVPPTFGGGPRPGSRSGTGTP